MRDNLALLHIFIPAAKCVFIGFVFERKGMGRSKYETVIKARTGWFDMDLKEIIRYRDLIWLFVKRDFVVTYKQTILGPVWLFLTPLISSVVYTFVFGELAGISTDGLPKILF